MSAYWEREKVHESFISVQTLDPRSELYFFLLHAFEKMRHHSGIFVYITSEDHNNTPFQQKKKKKSFSLVIGEILEAADRKIYRPNFIINRSSGILHF